MLDGAARKIALPFVLFSAIGWITYAVGFGITNFRLNEDYGDPATDWLYFPHWGFGVSALLLYGVTITHLFCGNPVTIFLIMFFQTFFYACGGAVAYKNGVDIHEKWSNNKESTLHNEEYDIIIQFSGAGVAMLFYWVSLLFWPCFRRKGDDYEDA